MPAPPPPEVIRDQQNQTQTLLETPTLSIYFPELSGRAGGPMIEDSFFFLGGGCCASIIS